MKKIITYIILILLASCSNLPKEDSKINDKMTYRNAPDSSEIFVDSVEKDFAKFDKQLTELYDLSNKNKIKAISEANKLIEKFTREKDPYLTSSKKISSLHYFKGEIFYHLGAFDKSLNEFKFKTGYFNEIPIACIYVRQKKYDCALSALDSISKGYYLHDFLLANYYETIGDKQKALTTYRELLSKDWLINGNYKCMKSKIEERVLELNKPNSILLKELYFPTINPKFINDTI